MTGDADDVMTSIEGGDNVNGGDVSGLDVSELLLRLSDDVIVSFEDIVISRCTLGSRDIFL